MKPTIELQPLSRVLPSVGDHILVLAEDKLNGDFWAVGEVNRAIFTTPFKIEVKVGNSTRFQESAKRLNRNSVPHVWFVDGQHFSAGQYQVIATPKKVAKKKAPAKTPPLPEPLPGLPKCRACGCDALSCSQIGAHGPKIDKLNRAAIRRWKATRNEILCKRIGLKKPHKKIGGQYQFFYTSYGTPEVHPDYRQHSGQVVTIMEPLPQTATSGPIYSIRASDGWQGTARSSELRSIPKKPGQSRNETIRQLLAKRPKRHRCTGSCCK